MSKFKFILAILILVFFSFSSKAQEIHDLPFAYNSFSSQTINDNFKRLHEFSERIYTARKLKPIINATPGDHLFSNERWPLGTWGNGYFSESIHHRKYPQPNIYTNWNTYTIPNPDPNILCKSGGWYDCFKNKHEDGEVSYLSSHPLIWHTGRRILAYIHAYKHSESAIYLSRIKEGLQYLIDEQNESGGYNWYLTRVNQNSTANYKVKENFIHGSAAIRSLSEGYSFLNSIGDYSMNSELWSAINKGGEYLTLNKLEVINDYQPINGRSWYVWALIGVYKVTGKSAYLKNAEEVTIGYLDYQRNDGSWRTPQKDKWHDSFMQYHGIILRGLSELYSLTNDEVFKTNLRSAIINSINHVIDYNKEYGGKYTRLNTNGFTNKYHRNDTIKSSTQLYTASSFQQGLIHAKKSMNFSESDVLKVDQLIQGTLKALISEIHTHKVPGINMMSLALTLNNSFDHPNIKWSGSIQTSNITFDKMSPVDFNNDGIDELALYDKDNKLYNVYKNNTNSPLFTQNTTNGALFSLMTSGDFDNDGKDEIALYRSSHSDGLVSIMNEDLSWSGSNKTFNTNFDMITPFDYDNDGFKDIALYDREAKSLKIYKNRVDTPAFTGNTLNGPLNDLMVSGDFDGDGEDEIAFYRRYDGQISIVNGDLSWEASIRSNVTDFNMITSIDYDNDGLHEIALYDSNTNLLKIYKKGSDQALFARYTNNGEKFDIITSGNFDSDPDTEIAFYRKSDGLVSIFNIDINYSNEILKTVKNPNSITEKNVKPNVDDLLNLNISTKDDNVLIQYTLKENSNVELALFNLSGRKLSTIINGDKKLGKQELSYNTSALSSGVYIFKIVTNNASQSTKTFVK